MNYDFDLIICGGGMVGTALAALLLHEATFKDCKLALIEPHFPTAPATEPMDIRVSAISRATERVFKKCRAWTAIQPHCTPYDEMVIWDAATTHSKQSLHFAASALGEPNLGYIVANNQLQWNLLNACAHSRITKISARVKNVRFEPQTASVILDDTRQLTARLIIAADGARSVSRECVGIKTQPHPYQQTAVVARITTARPHQQTAWQRFLPTGPIALLPLSDGSSSIVWTTTPEHAATLLQLPATECAAAIATACDHVLGTVTVLEPRAAFPLQWAHAEEYCRPRFVLVGDAAHSIHPLAGQGVNLGFMDAAALVQTLSDACIEGSGLEELGELRPLRRYARWRKTENALAIQLVDGLNHLFCSPQPAIGTLRRTGLQLLNHLPSVKRRLMLHALGLAGEHPRLVTDPDVLTHPAA